MLATTKEKERAGIAPLVHHRFCLDRDLSFSTACFGGTEDKAWSLGPLQEPGDPAAHPELARKISEAMYYLGADRVWAPNPTAFNGQIVQPIELSRVLKLGKGVILFRHKEQLADGTFLRHPGDAGIFSAGGCGVLVLELHGRMLFAHMGRECLIDRSRVLGGTHRSRESVVDYAMEALLAGNPQRRPQEARAWVLYSIKPEQFLHRYDDPRHTKYNRRVGPDLRARGLGRGAQERPEGIELDLPRIAQLQLMQLGVPEGSISLKHCYLSDELPTTRTGGGRYLVAVARH